MNDSAERLKPWAGFAGSVLAIGRNGIKEDMASDETSRRRKRDLVAYLLSL